MLRILFFRNLDFLCAIVGGLLIVSCEQIIEPPRFENTHDPLSINFAPDPPGNVLIFQKSDKVIDIYWKDSTAHTIKFRVERRDQADPYHLIGEVSSDSLHLTDTTGVLLGSSYAYRIGAVASNGNITYSPESFFTFSFQSPSNLTVVDSQRIYVFLSWTNNTNFEKGFIIERDTGSSEYKEVGRTSQNVTSFLDTDVDTNTTYQYRVRAFTALNVSKPSSSLKVDFYPDVTSAILISSPGGFELNPTGDIIAVAGYSDGTVQFYSAQTGTPLRTLQTNATPYSLAFSPDGHFLALAFSNSVQIWDAQSGTLINSLPFGAGQIQFSHDGTYLAATTVNSGDSTTLWNTNTWTFAKSFQGGGGVAFSPNQDIIATGVRVATSQFIINLWNLSNGALVRTLNITLNGKIFFTFDTSGKILLSLDYNAVYATRLSDGSLTFQTAASVSTWYDLACDPSGRMFAAGGDYGAIRLWRIRDFLSLWSLNLGPYGYQSAYQVAFTPDGSKLITGNEDAIRQWSLRFRWTQGM